MPKNTNNNKIAFQGELGANSHMMCTRAYPDMEVLPCPTFADAFAAIENGAATLGMIPIENSLAGRVVERCPQPCSGIRSMSSEYA